MLNYTKEITAIMHKALPRLTELTPWCEVWYRLHNWNNLRYAILEWWETHSTILSQTSQMTVSNYDFEILWHTIKPLHLLEVLKTMYFIDWSWDIMEYVFDWGNRDWKPLWIKLDLKLPLDQQSEEVQKEIYLLLKSVLWTNNN